MPKGSNTDDTIRTKDLSINLDSVDQKSTRITGVAVPKGSNTDDSKETKDLPTSLDSVDQESTGITGVVVPKGSNTDDTKVKSNAQSPSRRFENSAEMVKPIVDKIIEKIGDSENPGGESSEIDESILDDAPYHPNRGEDSSEIDEAILEDEAPAGYADAHFHLFRMAKTVGKNGRPNYMEVLQAVAKKTGVQNQATMPLKLAVASVCDPEKFHRLLGQEGAEYMSTLVKDGCLKFAFGVHPTQISQVIEKNFNLRSSFLRDLRELLLRDGTVGFGEVGLDFLEDSRTWRMQEQVLTDLLLAIKDILTARKMPIVIHLRNNIVTSFKAISDKMRKILKMTVGLDHPIQLHCFTGSVEDMQEWSRLCPQVMFSLAVGKFVAKRENTPAARMVRAVPDNKIMLETDSPYLGGVAKLRSCPFHIVSGARQIALFRGVKDYRDVLALTLRNTQRFFGVSE